MCSWSSIVEEPLAEGAATERAAKSANLNTRQLLPGILQFHSALRADTTHELSALVTFDVGVVAEGCCNFHGTTKWHVAQEQSMFGSG